MRGLNAPPRSTVAPASFTACATAVICSLLSTEQGPAIIASFLPPTTVFPILISLGAGWNARFAFLNGSATFMMQWKDSSWSGSMRLVSPVRPRMVISVPTIGLTDTPRATTALVTVSISCWVVPCFKTIIMLFNLLRQSLLAQNHYWLKWTKKSTEARKRASAPDVFLNRCGCCFTVRQFARRKTPGT